jgi:hypothetical protein
MGALLGSLVGSTLIGTVVGAPFSLVALEAVKRNPTFVALVTQLGAKLDGISGEELRAWLDERARRFVPFRSFVIANEQPLRQIATTTPELKWMLKYIDFIVGRVAGAEAGGDKQDATASKDERRGGFGAGAFGEGPFGG